MNKYETIEMLASAAQEVDRNVTIEGAVRKVLDGDRLGVEDAIRLRQEYGSDMDCWHWLEDVFYDVIDNVELGIAPIYHPATDHSGVTAPAERELGIFESAAKALRGAFHWSDDIKGHNYWSELDKNLQDRVDNGDGPRLEPFDFGAGFGPMARVAHVKDVVFNKIRWEDDIDGEAYWMDVYKELCRVYTSFDGDHFGPARPNPSSALGASTAGGDAARDLNMLARARDIVLNKVNWGDAAEGELFWDDTYEKLYHLSQGGDPTAYSDRTDASVLIDVGMVWGETQEGHTYWQKVQAALEDHDL